MQVHPPWEPAFQPLVLQRLSGLGVGPDLDTNLLVVEPMKAGLAFPVMFAVTQRARLSNWDPTVLWANFIDNRLQLAKALRGRTDVGSATALWRGLGLWCDNHHITT